MNVLSYHCLSGALDCNKCGRYERDGRNLHVKMNRLVIREII